jgi:hypothetical protein
MRRPSRAIIVAFVVLSVFATALLAAPAGMAQELDPLAAVDQSLDGGNMAVPTDVEAGLEDAIEAGGAPAVLEPPKEPTPSPAPAPKPQSDVSPPLPDTGGPSETAPSPAPESQPTDTGEENAVPAAPGAPINLNVDIRILSPGDNGDVTQDITMPGSTGQVGGGTPAQPLAWTWNWVWNWTTPAADDDVEDAAEEILGEVLGGSTGDPGEMFAGTLLEQPPPIEPEEAGPALQAGHPPSHRPEAAAPARLRSGHSPFVGAKPTFFPTVGGNSVGPAAVVADVAGATDRRQPDRGHAPAPKQAPPALPSAAASSVGGGSSAPFAAAILALLCLLAPRVLELARSRPITLSSQLSSSRLERPG